MADEESKTKGRTTVEVSSEALQAMTGSTDKNRALVLVRQAAGAIWAPTSDSQEYRTKQIEAVTAALTALAPGDELEGMLAAQMVATHNAVMECLRRAMIEGQSFEGRDQNLRHAGKLLGVYTRQMETLDKHRGKGQQKITVEHVTVNAGGQAIVGNVEAGTGSASAAGDTAAGIDRAALSHDPAPLVPGFEVTTLRPKQKTPAR